MAGGAFSWTSSSSSSSITIGSLANPAVLEYRGAVGRGWPGTAGSGMAEVEYRPGAANRCVTFSAGTDGLSGSGVVVVASDSRGDLS